MLPFSDAPFLKEDIQIFAKEYVMKPEKIDIVASIRNLHDLSKSINSTLKIDEVVEVVLHKTSSLMRSDKVLILLLEQDTNVLSVFRSLGFAEDEIAVREFKNIRSFDHCIVHKGTVIRFSEVIAPDEYAHYVAAMPFLARMIFAPLEINGKACGLLGVTGREQEVSFIELEMFCSLGSQAAVAIENANLYTRLKNTLFQTSEALAEAINSRDPYTGGHTRRVQQYSLAIANTLDIAGEDIETLKLVAILHDIGKIGIDDTILRKGGVLSADEQLLMKKHPEIGARILGFVDGIEEVALGVLHHHEWFDGSGYPDGLSGDAIPLSSRIVAIADVYDALTTDRPYRSPLPGKEALAELIKGEGTHFDPALVRCAGLAMKPA
jgi:HD-GYP domain-containing protein (c-di-GMP phosphodiesterase class II)